MSEFVNVFGLSVYCIAMVIFLGGLARANHLEARSKMSEKV
jgi:hypothetical protein